MIEEAGIAAIRAKSVALTSTRCELADDWLAPSASGRLSSRRRRTRWARHLLASRDARGDRPALAADVIPDYRDPGGLRIGLSPLSTSFEEVHRGLAATRDVLKTVLLERAGLA